MIGHRAVDAHRNGDCWYGCPLCEAEPYVDCCWCSREIHEDDLCHHDDPACARCCTTIHGREAVA